MSLGDRDSYYKDFGTKRQNRRSHSDDLSVLFKNSAENNNNGAVVGHKRPIANNDGGSNTRQKLRVVRIWPRLCLTSRSYKIVDKCALLK